MDSAFVHKFGYSPIRLRSASRHVTAARRRTPEPVIVMTLTN
jgi:hypothetical protein